MATLKEMTKVRWCRLRTQREILKKNILKTGNWPASKKELITKHQGPFLTFIKSIDFEQL
jgi:hypothetical protein